jgi:uncharacterized protein (DUF849 family)
MKPRKVIITCAVTGAVHTPSMSPHLPITPEEIAKAALEAAHAGASVIHLHVRDPETGRPVQSSDLFAPILETLRDKSNCIANLTTGGAPTMTLEERLAPLARFKPELASLNMGSMNFGLFPMLERFKEFKHDWEFDYLDGSRDRVFKNTFSDIERILTVGTENNTRFEYECYDIGHLYTLAHFAERRLIEPPFFIQTVFGILGGIGAHHDDVAAMKRTADRIFGNDYQWSVLGVGRNQLPIAAISAASGGHVRVGLEDSLWLGAGRLAESSAQQVTAVRQVVEGMGLEIATPDEVRELLALKGKAATAF